MLTVGLASPVQALETFDNRFEDDDRTPHEGAIHAISVAGITVGCNAEGTLYCPDQALTRGELATMIARARSLAPVEAGPYLDLAGNIHGGAINALAGAGIDVPCAERADRFCPTRALTRGEIAAFLAQAFALDVGPPRFVDTVDHFFRADINRLAAAGITRGCTADRYCPDQLVTRAEVATMFVRALGLEVYVVVHPVGGEFPGQPPVGNVLWGAAVGQNSDPWFRLEQPVGRVLGVRRTFFQWHHIDSGYLESILTADVTAGRLPWASLKTPGWARVGTGQYDDQIDALLMMLSRIPGDIWLSLHHEPEGGGGINSPDDPSGPAGHLAMNRRVRQRMTALGISNVALAPILMSWTWDSRSGRNPDAWWDPAVYDFLGVDHYVCQADAPDCRSDSLLDPIWFEIRRWAEEKQVDIAVGEWGMRGDGPSAGARLTQWFSDAVGSHLDGQGARVIALAAFDSAADTRMPSWELRGTQLDVFLQLLTDPRSAD